MKLYSLFAIIIFFIGTNALYAKGGHGCGGHGGHCGHGHSHAAIVYAGGHHSGETDEFSDLRDKIYSGYLVYKQDTQAGNIICSDNMVSVKSGALQDSTISYAMNDSNLQAVCITNNGKSLYLTRLNGKKGIYRLFHTGRLMIYDTYYSFDFESTKFYENKAYILQNDEVRNLTPGLTLSTKRALVANINKTYGSNLVPKEYNKQQLLDYVNKLN